MMELFRQDNTDGYSDQELDALNAEWETRSTGLDPNSDEYQQTAKAFADEVGRRR